MSRTDVAFGTNIPADLLTRFREKRVQRDKLEAAFEVAEAEYRETEEELWELMAQMGMKSMHMEGLGTLTRTVKGPYCGYDKNDPFAKAHFEEWTREQGLYEELFEFQPSMARLNGIVKDMRRRGEAVPPGIGLVEHKRIQVLKR